MKESCEKDAGFWILDAGYWIGFNVQLASQIIRLYPVSRI